MNHPILNHKATFVARPYTNVVTLCFDIGLSLLPIKRLAHHALTQGLEPTVLTWRILAGGTDSYSVVTHRPPRALALTVALPSILARATAWEENSSRTCSNPAACVLPAYVAQSCEPDACLKTARSKDA